MFHQINKNRRSFLKTSTSLASATIIAPIIMPGSVLGQNRKSSPNERITIGVIGTGSHGIDRNIKRFIPEPDCQIVAVCDVDRDRRLEAKNLIETRYAEMEGRQSYKGCDAYNDFREIIERDDIDAIMNATPDHWHVIPSVMAAYAGKDVMCEKPLSLTVTEGRALSDAISKNNRIFQTATENRSDKNYHRMCQLVRNGRIGKLKTIWVDLPTGHTIHEASKMEQPVPEGFDYDFWLGQAPEAPYSPARCHWNFRWIYDYSGGMLTDWGAHMIDLAQWAMGTELTGPIEVDGTGIFPEYGLYNTATQWHIEYLYDNDVKMIVRSREPALRFEGTEGWIGNVGWRGELQAEPKSILEEQIGPDEIHLYTEPAGEQRNFLDCVKSRKQCYAPAEVGHRTISIAHIGNISMMLKRKLEWNPEKERFVDDPVANWLLKREMRDPWNLDKILSNIES